LSLNPEGLYASVLSAKPVLCAACHASNAQPGTGRAGIPPLTSAMHLTHARARDPISGLTPEASANRSACYSCHPGSSTKCLRGAMGAAIAGDGSTGCTRWAGMGECAQQLCRGQLHRLQILSRRRCPRR